MTRETPVVGETYTVECPFVREAVELPDEDGYGRALTWRPGIFWMEERGEFAHSRPAAHAFGSVAYTVISIHKLPRPFPARVFFTRKWTDPNGRSFGKSSLHILTLGAFRARCRGYRYGGYSPWEPLFIADLTADERTALLAGPQQ